MYKRNIRLSYILAFLNRPWFWLGIWIFYYLRFTGYGGIGIIESILVATMVLTEIPTGAVADLLGKKKTLIMAFLLQAVGGFIFGFAQNIYWIGAAVFIAVVGGTFYSGTMEAFLYDSLKQDKKEKEYDKVQSRINSLQLLAPAVFGAIGGFMYRLSPGLPFLASGVFFSVAFLLAFLLKEPPVDTEKFSWASFVFQTKAGWRELTKSKSVKKFTILRLYTGVF